MDEIPSRKSMRLSGYDYGSDGAYFITICTHTRVHLFDGIEVGAARCGRPDAVQLVEKWLYEIHNKFPHAKIDKHVVMPDHIHFIVFLTGDHAGSPLPRILDWFKTMFTNDYIRGVKSGRFPPFRGHIWQRGYSDHVIRDEDDYQTRWRYIDENPARWSERRKLHKTLNERIKNFDVPYTAEEWDTGAPVGKEVF
jgi:REP element-mobilizing transposase RayT